MSSIATAFQEQVRGELTRQIAERGYAPSSDQIAILIGCSKLDIEEALLALHSSHSLLLHPHKIVPWVVHPFALYPASCWVQIGNRGYWATCLYCALGIASALKADADIYTRFGGESGECVVRVREQKVMENDIVFHLSTPLNEWWDNVIHACASFQPFRHEGEVEIWCERHAMRKGAVVPLPQLWQFASAWYGDYISRPWRKRSVEEIRELCRLHGLEGPFWSVE